MPRPASSDVDRPTHVFFLFADHFEPDYDVERVERWSARYRALAARHHDSAARPLQHTWLYPGEQVTMPILRALRHLTAAGLGEVELHLHHDFDTADSLRLKLRDAIEDFQRFGFLKAADGSTRFAFIHGNSGLDNSNGPVMCGVNTELRPLHDFDTIVPPYLADGRRHCRVEAATERTR